MPTFSTRETIEVSPTLDEVFEQISNDELVAEANKRCIEGSGVYVIDAALDPEIERVYYDVIKLPAIPESLRQFLMRVTGRVL